MWFLILDEETGLISEDPSNDGWKAVRSFRKVFDKYGLEGMTLVALSCDYLSPWKDYSDEERPYKAMEEIYDSRKKVDVKSDLFVNAFADYKAIQIDSEMELDKLNNKIELRMMSELDAISNSEEMDLAKFDAIQKKLYDHRSRVYQFKKNFDKEKHIRDFGISSNGYVMSRIERHLRYKRNSKFANPEREIENPNKLGI